MPTFTLVDLDGNDLGPYRTAADIWRPGDRIPRGPGNSLEVVSVRRDAADAQDVLVVKRVP